MISNLLTKLQELWLRFKIAFLGYEITFDTPDPIEIRDNAIEQYRKRLEYEILYNILTLRYDDDHFYNYMEFLKRYSLNSGMILTDTPDAEKWDELMNVLSEQARKQADFFWTLNNVVPVQLINIPNEEEDNKGLPDQIYYYSLEYNEADESIGENRKAFSLEIVKNELTPNAKTLPFMPLFQYFDVPAVGNMADLGVKIANEHYVGDAITSMVDACDTVETIESDNKLLPSILRASHGIAMDTMRGAGNFIIVDEVDIPWLSISIQETTTNAISRDEQYYGIHEDSLLKYEFTINNQIRVFSSDIFSKITEGKGMNMLIGYSGINGSTDSGTFLVPTSYFKWKDMPFQSNELRDAFTIYYGSEPMSPKELEVFAEEAFWEFANETNAKHSYGAEIEYGVGATADTKGKSKQSNYYRAVQINFDKGAFNNAGD